ncbi:8-oxo-dGTP diphosphatase [Bradyrhizobium lablabi]|uniref:8-oxo-dGTP diphosphatase n=1 Tax=Bradyrhizobium lablabi TaxID=722472 RepID=A0A1M6JNG7_9BRAD|nr:NUDIX hydrolase [Bradyrhizobium lablabi]SHJ48113.1 8-oxo-dGTP diphosphatase [Bradyrhizobium lablabi]
MAREPVLAAGGIVLRQEETPLIAVVRLRKRNEWVLPKGKLDDGETARAAAKREVLEETGHDVSVQEFLGTLVYESGGRSKVVHYWRMEASGEQAHELMDDVKAVDWLPLDDAVERLSRGYERAFLANVGPLALQSAALAEEARRPKVERSATEKRRSRRPVVQRSPIDVPDVLQSEPNSPVSEQEARPSFASEPAEAELSAPAVEEMPVVEAQAAASELAPQPVTVTEGWRAGMVRKVRGWLRRTRSDLNYRL